MEFKEKLLEYKHYLIIAAIIFGLMTFNIYTLTLVNQNEEENEDILPIETKTKATSKIKVDIKGEIKAAGVYELDYGSRVNDLINKAGGLTKQADTSIINLSKILKDEMVIIIYNKTEVAALKKGETKTLQQICPKENNACPENELETINKETSDNIETTNDKISINSANEEQLQKLPGIGASKAKAIVSYRKENGNFKALEDIKKVSGIGESAYEKIKDQITL